MGHLEDEVSRNPSELGEKKTSSPLARFEHVEGQIMYSGVS